MALRSIPPTTRLDFDGANRENRGIDALTGHLVVIKTVIDAEPGRYRLEGESRKELTTELNHPYMMGFFQVEIMGDYFYLVMELQDGNVYELTHIEGFVDARGLFQLGENYGDNGPHPLLGDGTSLFMAPEVEDLDRDDPHTTKIDIWSLCVSLCFIFGFGLTYDDKVYDKQGRVQPDWISVLEAMAANDPKDRVSAGDVLAEMFRGMGRVTNAE
ncbi:hypothetical protein FVEN_g5990 [Fusarium venenatum]|uniref:kinase-like domain-containing protein n=1 Tax=Fusarium venenatum TaxID=56646 RepID=UPI001D7123DA|nr:hypothetical protein FVEN_g5990 [Fusarium venenatum]KAH6992777.1 kinase-like domain-containing protein [Fusarium venenatum]